MNNILPLKSSYFLCVLPLLTWVAFYPGSMSVDSFMQLYQAETLVFSSHHPPIMAFVWSVFNIFFPYQSGLLFFHLAMLWGAIFILFYLSTSKYRFLFLIIPFLPWVSNFEGVLWKDVGMAYSLLFAFALFFCRQTKIVIVATFVCLFYGLNVRANAFFAGFPLIYLYFYVNNYWKNWKQQCSAALIVFVALIYLGNFFTYTILDSKRENSKYYFMIDDLVGISYSLDTSFLPGIPMDDIYRCANENIGKNTYVGRIACISKLESSKIAVEWQQDITKHWFEVIKKYPFEYLVFRLKAFSYLLRSPELPPYYTSHFHTQKEDELSNIKVDYITNKDNVINFFIKKSVFASVEKFPFLFKPYFWLSVSFVLLTFALLLRKDTIVCSIMALSVSSILYIFSYILLTPMADFRYIYWSVLACTISLIFISTSKEFVFNAITNSWKYVLIILCFLICLFIINFDRLIHIGKQPITKGEVSYLLEKVVLSKYLHDLPNKLGSSIYANSTYDLFSVSSFLGKIKLMNNVKDLDGAYSIIGNDPFIYYTFDTPLDTSEVDAFRFVVTGNFKNQKLSIQIFFWGDTMQGPDEEHSLHFTPTQGPIIIPFSSFQPYKKLKTIKGIRVDFDNVQTGKTIYLDKLELLKRTK